MKKKALIVAGCLLVAGLGIAATYSTSVDNLIVTGNGGNSTDIALPSWGVNQNAALQVSRNGTGDGGGQGAAIDAYASGNLGAQFGGGYIQRWWSDGVADGGKVVAVSIDYGGQMRMRTSLLISGQVTDLNGTGPNSIPLPPTSDSFMLGLLNDLGAGATIYSAASYYAHDGDSNAQSFVAMGGYEVGPYVTLALDGASGKLRWTGSASNTFAGATWDATFGRVSAHILGDSTTSLQPLHLDEPSGLHDIDGLIVITAAANGTYTFGTAYASAPVCVASPISNPGANTWWVTTTTTTVKVNLNVAATITFGYHCAGNPN